MASEQTKKDIHWNYFLAIEQDLIEVARYIEFAEDNFDAYSIELAHLLMASASEVDVIAKLLSKQLSSSSRPSNITDYKNIITRHISDICKFKIYIPRFGIELVPWSDWKIDKNPSWWKAYTDVKHHRNDKYKQANLKHTLNATAALLTVLFYYYRELLTSVGQDFNINVLQKEVTRRYMQPPSSLLKLEDDFYYHTRITT